MNDVDAASMRALCDEHGAALCRYAVRLTGDRARAEDVAQATLLRAWRHPELFNDSERSVRAWRFTVARNMIIDERRSLRFRSEACELDGSGTPDHAGVDEVNAALHRLLIGDALAKKSRLHYALRARRLTLQEAGVRYDAKVVAAPRLDTGRCFRQAALRMRK